MGKGSTTCQHTVGPTNARTKFLSRAIVAQQDKSQILISLPEKITLVVLDTLSNCAWPGLQDITERKAMKDSPHLLMFFNWGCRRL